jgi:GNAT superfamily N-acetyltransferase
MYYSLGRLPEWFTVLVAEDHEGHLVGWLEGRLDANVADHLAHPHHPPPHAYVYSIAVNPESQRQGVGSALMRAFVDLASAANLTWIALTPAQSEPASARSRAAFFAATGLQQVDPDDPSEGMVAELPAVVSALQALR